MRRLNKGVLDRFAGVSQVEATIQNYELAFRMQTEVPGVLDLQGESEATRKLYGLDDKETEEFGRECLLARRLVEKGVTASQVTGVLQANNVSFPAGDIVDNGQSLPVRVTHQFDSIEALESVVVKPAAAKTATGAGAGAGAGAPGSTGAPGDGLGLGLGVGVGDASVAGRPPLAALVWARRASSVDWQATATMSESRNEWFTREAAARMVTLN